MKIYGNLLDMLNIYILTYYNNYRNLQAYYCITFTNKITNPIMVGYYVFFAY